MLESSLGCTILGALISGFTAYFTLKLKCNIDEKIKTKELLLNEKKKAYLDFFNNTNLLKFDYDQHDIEKLVMYLSFVELFSDDELYDKCQELPQFILNLNTSDEKVRLEAIGKYAKCLREIKDAMRKELKVVLEIK